MSQIFAYYFDVNDVNLVLVLSVIEGKGSGAKGGGFRGGSRSPGTFGGGSNMNRGNTYGGGKP